MEEISTRNAPDSIGPFSQGVIHGDTVYVSGQGPIDPASGDVIDGDVSDETARTLKNIEAILKAAGVRLDDVVKATVFLRDMGDYDEMNETYQSYMSEPYPARSAVEVQDLPAPIRVEIEVIAAL